MDIDATKIIIPPNSARKVIGILADHGIYWCGNCDYPLEGTIREAEERYVHGGYITIRFDVYSGGSREFLFNDYCGYTEISVNKLIEILKQ